MKTKSKKKFRVETADHQKAIYLLNIYPMIYRRLKVKDIPTLVCNHHLGLK